MDQIKIGRFIAKCRKDRKITQSELAEKLGVTDKSIGNWEMVEICQIYLFLNHYVMN